MLALFSDITFTENFPNNAGSNLVMAIAGYDRCGINMNGKNGFSLSGSDKLLSLQGLYIKNASGTTSSAVNLTNGAKLTGLSREPSIILRKP